MRFSMDVLRARKGDCLMIHFGDKDDPHLIMIDGGPSKVYRPHLKPRIEKIRKARNLGDNEALLVDLLMISHIDDDHIRGILELTRELCERKRADRSLPIRVASLWHNCFPDMLDVSGAQLSSMESTATASIRDEIGLSEQAFEEFKSANILASVSQGNQLRLDAKFLKWRINREVAGKLIEAKSRSKQIKLDGGVKLRVAGPMSGELSKLKSSFKKWAAENPDKVNEGAALAEFVDKSVPNLSSLVLLAEVKRKTMLLTGDARGDKIIKGMELTRMLKKGKSRHVDLLKVPHHGSANNLETSFFERLTADHYVFSGNGEHGNPERESLEMLHEARGNDDYEVHLTYPIDEIDAERKKDWEKQRAREKNRRGGNPRPEWSAKKNSLKAFLAANGDFARKVRIVDENKPHMIDLLDAVKL